MGTFSAAHWAIALVLLAGLGFFVYLVGSLLWAGAKSTGSRWKFRAVALLLPIAFLAIMGVVGAAKAPPTEQGNQYPGLKPFNGKLDGE